MPTKSKFDPRRLFSHPLLAMSCKFSARATIAALWGVSFHPTAPASAVVAVCVALGSLLFLLAWSFFGWDRGRLDASRLSLYGLYVAGEAMVVGALMEAFLGAATGSPNALALMLLGAGGSLFTVYPLGSLVSRNISEATGINPGE